MGAAIRAAPLSIILALLGACGGGGGGAGTNSDPSPITLPFSSFAAIRPNQTVVMDGTAVTASTNQSVAGNGDVTIISAEFNPVGAATLRLGYDASATLKSISISTPQPNSSVSFDRSANGHSISCGDFTCQAAAPTASAAVADAVALRWNYQSYGVWATDLSATSSVLGAVSAGRATPGSAVPTSGTAIFNGIASGYYFDPTGVPFSTSASMRASVDFSRQSIGFSTSDTRVQNHNTPGVPTANSALNLSGAFSYAQGVNAFSGPVSTAPGPNQLSGQGSGRFYGPAAEEIGGVYSLQGSTGVSRMIGGFGGKR